MINNDKYKITTKTREIIEQDKVFLIREYRIPLLLSPDDVCPIIFQYLSILDELIKMQKSKQYLKSSISKFFLR